MSVPSPLNSASPQPLRIAGDLIVRVVDVEKRYGKFKAVTELSFDIKRGSHVLLLGPNGAGKTTLIKCMIGHLNFDGRIFVNGIDVKTQAKKVRALIGYVPQKYNFNEKLSCYEHVSFMATLKGQNHDEVDEKLKITGLWDIRKKRITSFSHGNRQRVGVAVALLGNPPILIFDEPTASLDAQAQLSFVSLLKGFLGQGKTILTTTHMSGLGETANRILIMEKGKLIADGTPDDLLGKVTASGTIYAKVSGDPAGTIQRLKSAGIAEVRVQGDWVVVTVPLQEKVAAVRKLLADNGTVLDLVVEQASIESEYMRLFEGGTDS